MMLKEEYMNRDNREIDREHCCDKGCLNDMLSAKSFSYLMFYVFTMTDLYCRIYPMLLVGAYTKKRTQDEDNADTASTVYLAWFGVLAITLTFEGISYKNILNETYNSWRTVIKYLYFATFTITFFLLSTMGLAYLEKNVDFVKLMKWEFTGRMVLGLFFVLIITVHQTITLEYDEWIFGPTLYGYYMMSILCIASSFYIKRVHHEL